jgi:hypothetical protein
MIRSGRAVGIVSVAPVMHYGLTLFRMLPDYGSVTAPGEHDYFQVNYQLVLNVVFLIATAVLVWFHHQARDGGHSHHHHDHSGSSLTDRVLRSLAAVAALWLSGGVVLALFA